MLVAGAGRPRLVGAGVLPVALPGRCGHSWSRGCYLGAADSTMTTSIASPSDVAHGSRFATLIPRHPHLSYNQGEQRHIETGNRDEQRTKQKSKSPENVVPVCPGLPPPEQYTRFVYEIHLNHKSIQRMNLVTKLHNIIEPEKR